MAQADYAQVIGEHVGAGEIEIDQAGQLAVPEEHVVGKQVGVDDAAGQATRPFPFQNIQFDRHGMQRFGSLEEARKAYERDYVLKTLEGMGGNVTRTAAALGLERSHLYRKMKALGITPKEPS